MLEIKEVIAMAIFVGFMSLALKCGEKRVRYGNQETNSFNKIKSEAKVDKVSPFLEVSEGTRKTLIQHCGSCHQSTLDSHKQGAVAIFDLDEMEQWHGRLTAKTLDGLARRTATNNAITDEERATIQEFVALKQARLQ